MPEPIVTVEDLRVGFPIRRGLLRRQVGWIDAVSNISFSLERGQTLGLVGESGSGKTTTGRAILQLLPARSGSVVFEGRDLIRLRRGQLRAARRQMQMIFQDPFASLDPSMRVGRALAEPLAIHGIATGDKAKARVRTLLQMVGLPANAAGRFPHQFSGGQRQRIAIARALALEPALLICDEPVSALDVSIQSQVLNLLVELQNRLGLSYLFISHDLSVVRHVSHRVAVMYLGKIVELGAVEDVYSQPRHPYSVALLSSVPIPDPALERSRQPIILGGEIPSPANPPTGCRFHTRCWLREELGRPNECVEIEPPPVAVSPGHTAACHFTDRVEQRAADVTTVLEARPPTRKQFPRSPAPVPVSSP